MGQSRILHRTGYSLLYRRQGIYRFRKFVPKDLREIIGHREIKVSLRTTGRIDERRRNRGDFRSEQQARRTNHTNPPQRMARAGPVLRGGKQTMLT